MEMNAYFVIGLIIAVLLSYRVNKLSFAILVLYWLIEAMWSLGFIRVFRFSSFHWISAFDVEFSYNIDGLARIFSLLISGIGIVVFIYSWFYTDNSPLTRRKLFSILQIFAISMLGIVTTNDMIVLFLCWELTSLTSYLLIQFNVEDESANQAAFRSIFVSAMGALILLIGMIYLNNVTGSWDIHTLLKNASSITLHEKQVAFYLILIGVITKSAQFPFYFWLSGAMKAPTPVSAYLHSATMVNAGIYLLARFHPLFGALNSWYVVLSLFGLLTMICSGILSLCYKDLKSIFAYTTIFALGVMVYLLGGKSELPIQAFIIFLLFHGAYKAAGFMLIGIIDKIYNTRNLNELTGIGRSNLLLSINIIIIFSSMAGLPPFFGFTVKEIIYEAKLASPSVSYFLMSIGILSSMLISATSFRCLWYLYKKNLGSHVTKNPKIHNKTKMIFICPTILSAVIILFSFFESDIYNFIYPAVQAILPQSILFINDNSMNIKYMLSIATVCGGILLFLFSYTVKNSLVLIFKPLELKALFDYVLKIVLSFGKYITNITQNQSIETQLRLIISSILIFLFLIITEKYQIKSYAINFDITFINILIFILLAGSACSLLTSHKLLHNLISLSIIGLTLSFFFITNGAVDVAITQLLVEVLTIIILLIALRSTKTLYIKSHFMIRLINAILSLFFGSIITYLLFNLKLNKIDNALKYFYAQHSYPLAHGNNIVNVILVDFRSLDTYGEVMVIIATAIGVVILLRNRANMRRSG